MVNHPEVTPMRRRCVPQRDYLQRREVVSVNPSHTSFRKLLEHYLDTMFKVRSLSQCINGHVINSIKNELNVVLNVESSQHNVLGEEVEASSPIEGNVCRRCGAVTEKKLCQTVMNNRLGLVLLPENQDRGVYTPRSVFISRSMHPSLPDKNNSQTAP
mmetsp:Transcript_22838/g.55439  ORF Transcript_22838/g.55439 Transcript_22838/m.55439 type:complete len:158 (+) Transcript_22838:58-531(+)